MSLTAAAETASLELAAEASADRAATLNALYGRYSARLAAHVAERLARTGGDLQDVDDVTQSVWECTAQLLFMPEPADPETWLTLAGLANWVIAGRREREVPVGLRLSGAPVKPLLDRYDEEHVGRAMRVRREKVRRARESGHLGFSAYRAA
jgi:DNA-directed RNA polymerase specialized sigma24 family protein